MNIFYLDREPRLAAQYHTDKHVIKMILESAQLLCTAVNVKAGKQVSPYKTTHVNHPCSIWARQSLPNATWLYQLMIELDREYYHRYGKHHLSVEKLQDTDILGLMFTYIPVGEFTELPLAMPDEFKVADRVESYRNYYRNAKQHLHNWTNRGTPAWL